MSLQHAYAVTNRLTGLAAGSFAWSATATNPLHANDGKMDKLCTIASTATSVNVIIDLGAAYSISAVACLNHNLAGLATLKVEHATNLAFTTGVTEAKAASTLGTSPAPLKDAVLQFAAVTKRYWRLTWTWTGSVAMSVGELFFAESTALTRAEVYGHGGARRYINSKFDGYTGEQRGHYIAGPIASRRLPFEALTESERNELWAMYHAARGGAVSLLWCEQYEAVATAAAAAYQACLFGKLTEDETSWTEDDFGVYGVSALMLRSLAREVGS